MDRPCTFCGEGNADHARRLRAYPCSDHWYHVACVPRACKVVCPECACAQCALSVSRGSDLVYQPCGCAVHKKCAPWRAAGATCPRCQAAVTAVTSAARRNETGEAPPPSAAPTTVGASFTLNPMRMFGPSASKIFEIGTSRGIEGIKKENITFVQYMATGARLDVLLLWGACHTDLLGMGFTRDHVLDPRYFNATTYAKLGFTYTNLRTVFKLAWTDLRRFNLTFEQLRAFEPTLLDLCEGGFGFDDLCVYKDVRVEDWAKDPFNLAQSRHLLKPGKAHGFALTEERIDRLRQLRPGNWTDQQIVALWPRGSMNDEERALFGIPFDVGVDE
jgi:hypothetical protein